MITNSLLHVFKAQLQKVCIDDVPLSDTSRAGVVKIGPLQGEPEPDVARISITVHPNDPDRPTKMLDKVIEVNIPCSQIWNRYFTIKYRILLEPTHENLEQALTIASTVKARVEHAISSATYGSIRTSTESVQRGCQDVSSRHSLLQGGGPPDSFDFQGKFMFTIMTETTDCGS